MPVFPIEKCRSEEDLKSMDSRNKITQDMLQPKVERSYSDEEGSSDYLFELSDNDSDSSDFRWMVLLSVFVWLWGENRLQGAFSWNFWQGSQIKIQF